MLTRRIWRLRTSCARPSCECALMCVSLSLRYCQEIFMVQHTTYNYRNITTTIANAATSDGAIHSASLVSQAGCSHISMHFGCRHSSGVVHDQVAMVCVHKIWQSSTPWLHSRGLHTVSQLGHCSFSQESSGQRTTHSGFPQRVVCDVFVQITVQLGDSVTGWHLAEQTGSSHAHLHSGWHAFISVEMTSRETPVSQIPIGKLSFSLHIEQALTSYVMTSANAPFVRR